MTDAPHPPGFPVGEFVSLAGEPHYRIASYHRIAPFLISLPSDTDLWMFVASGGGLTAGRVDAEGSIFPYETVDRLHDAHVHTGPTTILHVEAWGEAGRRWEPFGPASAREHGVERALYKNVTGNQLVFEEVDHELGLAFRYRWCACDEFGWVRTSTLENRSGNPVQVRLLDGLRNVLPWGAPLALYQQASNLVDAYKKSEIDDASGLGIFSLTARVSDSTEPEEVLRANVVWCCGLDDARVHLSAAAIEAFREGKGVSRQSVLNGARGNYLVESSLSLAPGESREWHIVADTGRDHLEVARLRRRLLEDERVGTAIEAALRTATRNLQRNVGTADGIQASGRIEATSHHFANVLFNNMRGGVFLTGYRIPVADFASFLDTRNPAVAARHRTRVSGLGDWTDLQALTRTGRASADPDFERLVSEYLPLCFSRRHGDPSRPWNRFSIRSCRGNGAPEFGYEGNWRDIFQNWEALGLSFPGYLPNFVSKFVNASTVDGFNPYRITREGIEWEEPKAGDPWSNIGYWGDHQIIYLLKLLELLDEFDPTALDEMLGRDVFSYAEVPYRIRPYENLAGDPRNTIEFDEGLAGRIRERVEHEGSDGKLLHARDGGIYHANLLEKVLVPVLAKLSNFVPDAGIWMNTQRPEWNDANNALAGGGASVVTLCHLRRHLHFLAGCIERAQTQSLELSTEVVEWFTGIESALDSARDLLEPASIDGARRKQVLDSLGNPFSDYRTAVYERGFSGRAGIELARVVRFLRLANRFVERAIEANRREDGLFHSYNMLDFAPDQGSVEIVRLPLMLEGQVAALSAGVLDGPASATLLEALFASELYHDGHRSFLLYPERELPGFLQKNAVDESRARRIPLLSALLDHGANTLVAVDVDGTVRFAPGLTSRPRVVEALDALERDDAWKAAVRSDRDAVIDLFEDAFGHGSYTGRSGVMYGYEGLGCVYWHMVAKLLLATQECRFRAGDDDPARERLDRMYFRVRSGIGYEKTVAEYGAFPIDPYSHTPPDGGARQPGMTGQVKEEILTRFGELGVRIADGRVRFDPLLIDRCELLGEPAHFDYFDTDGSRASVDLRAGSLAFTFCQVPVVYLASDERWIEVVLSDGSVRRSPGCGLDATISRELFARSGRIREIRAGVRI